MYTRNICLYGMLLGILQATLVGCGTAPQVQAEIFELSEHVQVSTPTEIPLDTATTGCLFDMYGQNNKLLGYSRLGEDIKLVAIDIETHNIQRLFSDGSSISNSIQRYFIDMRKSATNSDRAELWGYDATNDKWLQIIEGQIDHPTIFESVVVWEEYRNKQRNIYGYNLNAGQAFTVAEGVGLRISPKIFENWVAYLLWLPDIPYQLELHAHSLENQEDILVGYMPTTETANYPSYLLFDIDHNRIAWRTLDKEIHSYDLVNRVETCIFTGDTTDTIGRIDIAGNLIVWNNGPQDKRGYDLLNNQTFDIPYLPKSAPQNTNTWSILLADTYIVWLIDAENKPDWVLGTPLAPGELTPVPLDPAQEKSMCNQKLFTAPIIRE